MKSLKIYAIAVAIGVLSWSCGKDGEVGLQGLQGVEGKTGPIGPAGATGATGATGVKGEDGNANVSTYRFTVKRDDWSTIRNFGEGNFSNVFEISPDLVGGINLLNYEVV